MFNVHVHVCIVYEGVYVAWSGGIIVQLPSNVKLEWYYVYNKMMLLMDLEKKNTKKNQQKKATNYYFHNHSNLYVYSEFEGENLNFSLLYILFNDLEQMLIFKNTD